MPWSYARHIDRGCSDVVPLNLCFYRRKLIVQKRLRFAALFAAAVLMCGLFGGCGASGRETASSVSAEADKLLTAHQDQLNDLYKAYSSTVAKDVEYRLYYDDTQSMLGFVEADNGQNTFVNMLDKSIDSAKGMLNNGFSSLKAYTLVDEVPGDNQNQELNWTEVDIVGSLQAQFLRSDFYTGSHTGHREGTLNHTGTDTKLGPLARLFADGNNPFAKGAFTVVVTDLREQNFDLDDLVNGLLSYKKENPSAEICIVGCSSNYTGEISIPVYSNSNAGADVASIDNYSGPASYYYIMAGPVDQMDRYLSTLKASLSDENIVWSTFEDLTASVGNPLEFALVKNTMEGKRTDDLLPGGTSSNITDATQAESLPASSSASRKRVRSTAADDFGVVIQPLTAKNSSDRATTSSIRLIRSGKRSESGGGSLVVSPYITEVWGSANIGMESNSPNAQGAFEVVVGPNMGEGKSEAFGSVSLISAYADLPKGTSAAAETSKNRCSDKTYWVDMSGVQLYEKVDGNWTSAKDAAVSSINVRFETVDGPLTEYNSQELLLSQNRHTGYLRVMIDNTLNTIDANQTYLLSVPIHTSMKADLAYGADHLLEMYNANIKEYTEVLQLLDGSGSHYRFDTSSEEAKQKACEQFARTPKLDILVQQLRNELNSNSSDDVQYVDFLLSAPQNTGRRTRK